MNRLIKCLVDAPALLIASLSALILAVAYGFQYNGYAPCDLCWYQRYPYMAVIALVLVAASFKRSNAPWVLFAVTGLIFIDAGIAGYHAGVEYKWWKGPSTCGGAFDAGNTELTLDTLYSMAERVVRCDEPAWTFGGISMAGYNMLAALGLGVYGLWNIWKIRGANVERKKR